MGRCFEQEEEGGWGERLLYAETTRDQRASEAKTCQHTHHPSTRGKPPTVSRFADTVGNRFPIGKVKATNNKERERGERPSMIRGCSRRLRGIEGRLRDGANSLDEPMASEGVGEGGSLSVQQPAASLDRFATFDPHISTTSLSDIPLPLDPRRHQLITNLPDTFIITTSLPDTCK
jgi:hypothetical protein